MILVTGGAGYIGTRLVPALLESGARIRVVDTLWFGKSLPANPRLEVIQADLADFDRAWLEDVDAIIHLAGLSGDACSELAPELSVGANITATARMAEAAAREARRRNRLIRCIFASTCSVYSGAGNSPNGGCYLLTEETLPAPMTTYARSKRAAELELLSVGADNPLFCPAILRMGTLFGASPRMRFDLVVNTFTLDAWRKRVLTLEGAHGVWRPLLHVDDAADAYISLLSAPLERMRNQVFNLVGCNYRIADLAFELAAAFQEYFHVSIEIERNELADNGGRSYRTDGRSIAQGLGICPNRAIVPAAIDIWNALERGDFGVTPQDNARYFNIRWLKNVLVNYSAVVEAAI